MKVTNHGMGTQILTLEKGNITLLTLIFYIAGSVSFFSNLSKIVFLGKSTYFVNHLKALKMCSLLGFYSINDYQHFNM